jgi:hypothetical protein
MSNEVDVGKEKKVCCVEEKNLNIFPTLGSCGEN